MMLMCYRLVSSNQEQNVKKFMKGMVEFCVKEKYGEINGFHIRDLFSFL